MEGKRDELRSDSIVITGMSGTFPQARNIRDLEEILYKKINPITKATRWTRTHPETSEYVGQAPGLDCFDAQFFMIHNRLADSLEPNERKTLEHCFQALYDAGFGPGHLNGRKVGVFMANSMSETKRDDRHELKSGLGIIGTLKTMKANRVSYWLGVHGPSYTISQGCGGSIIAIQKAYQALRSGECEAALVGGSNICLVPQATIQYGRMIQLSKDNKTKSFDENASGCVESDAICILFLQRAKDAKRVYAELCYAKGEFISKTLNCGFNRKSEEVTDFLNQFYSEANVTPDQVEYVEAFGCATPEVDKVELEVIDEVFNKRRSQSLSVGSVMSNIGHCEAATGIASISKVLLGYHRGQMAGNLHYSSPRKDVDALNKKRICILDNHKHFRPAYTAINGTSLTGVNTHVVLKDYYKSKDTSCYKSEIPYLITISGRSEGSVQKIFKDFKSRPIDPEELALHHNANEFKIKGHLGRGFIILDKDQEGNTVSLGEGVKFYDNTQRPLWFVYSGMGSQWNGMGTQLMRIPIFATSIKRCHKVLCPKGVDIVKIITSQDEGIFNNILNSFVGITAIQIGLTDVLLAIGLVPDNIIGHSLGELGCAYADGSLSAEQVILASYIRGLVSLETPFIRGAMFAVGLGYQSILKMLPPEIEVACHNSSTSSTISGPEELVHKFVKELKTKNIFAKEVMVSNIAYHSSYISDAGNAVLKYMKELIKKPKLRSDRWLSSSVPRDKWNDPESLYSSAEYHTNNVMGPVLFEEVIQLVPNEAVLVEIAPHGLLQAILRRALPADCRTLAITQRNHTDNVNFFLETIGNLYVEGFQPKVQLLYPEIEFPVSTGTPYISHLIEWNQDEKRYLESAQKEEYRKAPSCNFNISIHDDDYKYLRGNIIHGQLMYPFSAVLVNVWDTLAMMYAAPRKEISIQFRDLHFHLQKQLHDQELLKLNVSILRGSGKFQVTNDNNLLVTGFVIGNVESPRTIALLKRTENAQHETRLSSQNIYSMLNKRGYSHGEDFRSIHSSSTSFTSADLYWKDNWVTLIDGMLQLNALKNNSSSACVPVFIKEMAISAKEHNKTCNMGGKKTILQGNLYELEDYTRCGGIVIHGIQFKNIPKIYKSLPLLNVMDSKIIEEFDKNCYVLKTSQTGDLNALHWSEMSVPKHGTVKIKVHYAAINTHDMKRATGINPHFDEDQHFGMDFSGITERGEYVMGIVENGAVSTKLSVNPKFLWPVPNSWSLEDAATIPQAYVQAFYCLVIKAKIKHGMTILVHGGTGALGQAIIRIALYYNCKIFTTVSSESKKKFLLRLFPELNEQHIGYSRDESFKYMVVYLTDGRNCDIVINTIETKLKNISIRCCRGEGHILEPLQHLSEESFEFETVNLTREFNYYDVYDFTCIFSQYPQEFEQIRSMISEGIARGFVLPLSRLTYTPHEASRAFKLLSASQHRGRVLLKLWDPNLEQLWRMKPKLLETSNFPETKKNIPNGLQFFFSNVDSDEILASTDIVALPTLVSNANPHKQDLSLHETYLCIIPGLEGHYKRFQTLCEGLKLSAVVLQPGFDPLILNESTLELALRYSEIILNKVGVRKTFYLLGYEFGVPLVLEVAKVLESQGLTGVVYCIGGEPEYMQNIIEDQLKEYKSEEDLQVAIVYHMFELITGGMKLDVKLKGLTWQEMVDTCVKKLRKCVTLTTQYIQDLLDVMRARIVTSRKYVCRPGNLSSQVVILRTGESKSAPTVSIVKSPIVYNLNIPFVNVLTDLRCSAIVNRHLPATVINNYNSKNLCKSYRLDNNSL